MRTIKCKTCRKTIEWRGGTHQYCIDCSYSKVRIKERMAQWWQKRNLEVRERKIKRSIEWNKSPIVRAKRAKRDRKRNQRPEIKDKRIRLHKWNYHNNPQFRLNFIIGNAIRLSLNGHKNGRHWEDLVGFTLIDLKRHLENLFTPEMSWDNQGSYWHIDHIIPQSWFRFTSTDSPEFQKCWSLDNLQSLEEKQNISKGDRGGVNELIEFIIFHGAQETRLGVILK